MSQSNLCPQNVKFISEIENEKSTMSCFIVMNDKKYETGNQQTTITKNGKNFSLVTKTFLNSTNKTHVDSSVVDVGNFLPITYNSANDKRNVDLTFNKNNIKGKFVDSHGSTPLDVEEKECFFDKNSISTIIRFLSTYNVNDRLKTFDFNPNNKTGVSFLTITSVSKGEYQSKSLGSRESYFITVLDEFNASTTYTIDFLTRLLWKEEKIVGFKKMEKILLE